MAQAPHGKATACLFILLDSNVSHKLCHSNQYTYSFLLATRVCLGHFSSLKSRVKGQRM